MNTKMNIRIPIKQIIMEGTVPEEMVQVIQEMAVHKGQPHLYKRDKQNIDNRNTLAQAITTARLNRDNRREHENNAAYGSGERFHKRANTFDNGARTLTYTKTPDFSKEKLRSEQVKNSISIQPRAVPVNKG